LLIVLHFHYLTSEALAKKKYMKITRNSSDVQELSVIA